MKNAQPPTLNFQRSSSPHPESDFSRWVLRGVPWVLGILPLLLVLFLTAPLGHTAQRDPFWPVGYEPAKPEPVVTEQAEPAKPEKPEAPPKPQPPAVKPVSDQDWVAARKSVIISGFTQATRPDTGETRALVMINRQSYAAGDTVCLTNAGIRFLWRVESAAGQGLCLTPVEAERIRAERRSSIDLPKTP